MPGDSTPTDGLIAFQDVTITNERRALLTPKLEALLAELVKIRELEPIDGEPATLWPWKETNGVG